MSVGPTGPEAPTAAAASAGHEHSGAFRRNATRTGAVLALLGAGAGGAIAVTSGSHEASVAPAATTAGTQPAEFCDTFQSTDSSANLAVYHPDAFLPKTGKVTSPDGAKKYVFNLFGKNGPLAGNGDIESAAAVMATVVVPAQRGEINDPNYSPVATFNQKIEEYKTSREQVVKDCHTAFDTLVQVTGYNGAWARQGEKDIQKFEAIRGLGNKIVGAHLKTQIAEQDLQGIQFKLGKSTKGLHGFTEVLVSTDPNGNFDGDIYIKGLKPTSNGTSTIQHGKNPNKAHPRHAQPQQNGTAETGGTSTQPQHTQGGGGTTGVAPKGKIKQSNPGPTEVNKPGKKPTRPGAPHPTPGPGGPGAPTVPEVPSAPAPAPTTPEKPAPAPTTPEKPAPTPPPANTTPKPPTQTTPPTETVPPKGSEPAPQCSEFTPCAKSSSMTLRSYATVTYVRSYQNA